MLPFNMAQKQNDLMFEKRSVGNETFSHIQAEMESRAEAAPIVAKEDANQIAAAPKRKATAKRVASRKPPTGSVNSPS
jgi:hypothetical protein